MKAFQNKFELSIEFSELLAINVKLSTIENIITPEPV